MYRQKTYYTNAKKTEYNGFRYDSKLESSYAQELDLRVKAKDIKSWERQVVLDLVVNDFLVCTYKVDFIIHHNDGTKEFIETKGYWTPYAKLKWKLFEALYSQDPNNILTVEMQGKQKPPKARKLKKKIYAK